MQKAQTFKGIEAVPETSTKNESSIKSRAMAASFKLTSKSDLAQLNNRFTSNSVLHSKVNNKDSILYWDNQTNNMEYETVKIAQGNAARVMEDLLRFN